MFALLKQIAKIFTNFSADDSDTKASININQFAAYCSWAKYTV